jgi:general secretion pathway protein N
MMAARGRRTGWRGRGAGVGLALAGRRGAVVALVALSLLSAGIIAVELSGGSDRAPSALPAAVAAPVPAALPKPPTSFKLPPLATYAEVTQRPLFSATRQPPPPEAGQDLLGKSNSFVLLGIILTPDERAVLIRHGHPAEIARLKEGQAVEGWTVQSILPDRITLQHGASEVELKLKDQPGNAGAPGMPRPPQPRG